MDIGHVIKTLGGVFLLALTGCGSPASLKEAYVDYFPVGAAVNINTIATAGELITGEFSSLTCENEMKPSVIHPRMNTWQFYSADEIADFARHNDMTMRGHTFVWHQQTPGWFFASMGGLAPKELLWERLREHMVVMAERYSDVVYAWDVVNEAISDDPDEYLRPSPYLDILGEDYIAEAFILAHEIMPDAKLFYNDYSVMDREKQDKIYRLMSELVERGVPIDGIGIQAHWNLWFPGGEDIEKGIRRFADLGLDVHITELDVSLFLHNDYDTRYEKAPHEVLEQQADRYDEIFAALRDSSDYVQAVTFWGVADDATWLDNFPVKGRKNWPLLFDEEHNPKPAYEKVLDF